MTSKGTRKGDYIHYPNGIKVYSPVGKSKERFGNIRYQDGLFKTISNTVNKVFD